MTTASEIVGIGIALWIAYHVALRLVPNQEQPRKWSARLASTTFFLLLVGGWMNADIDGFDDGLALTLRAVLGGAVVLVTGWLVLPILLPVFQAVFQAIGWLYAWPAEQARLKRRKREEHAVKMRAAEMARREAEQRDRRQVAEEESSRQIALAQRRRDDARARCELLFSFYAPEISNRYSRKQFEEYVRRHLGDDRPPEHIEERIAQLLDILKQHLHRVDPMRRFANLEDLVAWYTAQKRQIDAVPDERMRRTLTAQLTERYADMTNRFLEEN